MLDPEQCDWIRHHHERWDGAGYPAARAADAIPEGAQLLALADVWDTMTSGRPRAERWRARSARQCAALTPENALAEIDHVAGTHLRPDAGTLIRTAAGMALRNLSGSSQRALRSRADAESMPELASPS